MSRSSYGRQPVCSTRAARLWKPSLRRGRILAESDQEDDREGEANLNDVKALQEALKEADEERRSLRDEVSVLKRELEGMKVRVNELWWTSCEQLAEFDATVTSKDEEIATLKRQLRGGPPRPIPDPHESDGEDDEHFVPSGTSRQRRGKAPPIDPFTGENPELRLVDWLPSLQRAAQWNRWSKEEELMQLAGHLRGRALQEWNLLGQESPNDFEAAVTALRERLDPGSRVLAGQDFRHTRQGEVETVADFVRRLERVFLIAYGSDKMGQETREVILHGQMQDGLRLELMKSPTVSGALTYKELCMSAKNEERRQAELRKRWDYFKQTSALPSPPKKPDNKPARSQSGSLPFLQPKTVVGSEARRCYNCNKPGHLAKDCRAPKTESSGRGRGGDGKGKLASTKQVRATPVKQKNPPASKATAQTADPPSFDPVFSVFVRFRQ